MDRKDFFKSACGLGVCSCVGLGLLSAGNLSADEKKEMDPKDRFVKNRFAKLIAIMDATLDEQTKNKIIESLGRECAKDPLISGNYVNNPDGFFNDIHNRWGENFTYDKEKGTVRIESPERDCVCPLVDSKIISKLICQCSVGWQSQTYNTIFGKNVEVKVVESVVRGGKRCVFEVKVLNG